MFNEQMNIVLLFNHFPYEAVELDIHVQSLAIQDKILI